MRRTERSPASARLGYGVVFLVLVLAVTALASATAPEAIANDVVPTAEAAAVKRAFAEYKAALNGRDGERAAAAVSANSFRYYDRMRRLALTAPRDELAKLEGTERMLVLSLRQQAPPELLADGSPEALVAYAVTTAAVTDTGIAKTELAEVEVQADLARGFVVVDGEPTRGVLQFAREGGRWKFDLEFAMKTSAGLIAVIAQKNGLSEDAVILELLSEGAGQPIGPEIWQPPAP